MKDDDDLDFDLLVACSEEELRILTGHQHQLWKLGEAAWHLDQDAGTLIFTNRDGIQAKCSVQIIGTYNTNDRTWLWGWDHPSVLPALRAHALKVKDYGIRHGIGRLTTRKVSCDEAEAWRFTAIAYKLGGAQGAYRGPTNTANIFMTFADVVLSMPSAKL